MRGLGAEAITFDAEALELSVAIEREAKDDAPASVLAHPLLVAGVEEVSRCVEIVSNADTVAGRRRLDVRAGHPASRRARPRAAARKGWGDPHDRREVSRRVAADRDVSGLL